MTSLRIIGVNCVGNLGDYAILEAMRDLLGSAVPGAAVVASPYAFICPDERRTARLREGEPAPLAFERPLPFLAGDRVSRVLSGVPSIVARYLYERVRRRLGRRGRPDEVADAAVFLAGGGHWRHPWLTANLLAQLRLYLDRGLPVYLMPHSMAPAILEHGRRLARSALARCRLVALRDVQSLETARRLGLADAVFCPDCAFALPDVPPDPAAEAGPVVLALRGGGRRCDPAYVARLAGIVHGLRSAGHAVRILTTCEADDATFLDALASAMPGVPQERPLSVADALRSLREAAVVVTDRFHCMVFSMLAHVPVVPVTNIAKVQGMARTLALPFTIDDEGELDASLLRRVAERRAELVALQDAFARDAREQLARLERTIAADLGRPPATAAGAPEAVGGTASGR